MKETKAEIVLFETEDKSVSLPVEVKNETVWLNRNQMAELFDRDVKTIGSYIRNRNLFYVCCSRPKKRLFFFVSVKIDDVFRDFLHGLVGDENIMTYEQYMGTEGGEY